MGGAAPVEKKHNPLPNLPNSATTQNGRPDGRPSVEAQLTDFLGLAGVQVLGSGVDVLKNAVCQKPSILADLPLDLVRQIRVLPKKLLRVLTSLSETLAVI